MSKIGKSQFVAALIDHDNKEEAYFWYTFTGDAGDLTRLARQLAIWLGERTGSWQLMDDIERAGLQPSQVFERLGNSLRGETYIVLDDCHRACDDHASHLLANVILQNLAGHRLILIGERKNPALAAIGAREIALSGLNPRESLMFATKLGLDLRTTALEFAILAVQVGGHPVMLRSAVKDLPQKPAPSDVLALTQRIPSIESAQAFIAELSNRIFFDLLRSADQRHWLARIASVGFPVTRGLALHLADVKPRLDVLDLDWNYLKSLLLDETSPDHYSVPPLLQQIAVGSLPIEFRRTLQTTAARYVFRSAIASKNVDFWDFEYALVALLGAGCYDEAAIRFIHSFPALITVTSFEPLELIFRAMNSEQTHAQITDPSVCWFMLQVEVHLRVQDAAGLDRKRVGDLLSRMRLYVRTSSDALPAPARAMLHVGIASVRIRMLNDSDGMSERGRHRIFASLHSALRCALNLPNGEFAASILELYDDLYPAVARPNVDLITDALLRLPEGQKAPLSAHALIAVYSRYAIASKYSESAMQVVQMHSERFRAAGLNDAYFACEHAAATILHDGRGAFGAARERVARIISREADLRLSPSMVAHGFSFIGDTYWAERRYLDSAECYRKVLHGDLGSSGLHQIVCERLCDSLIFLDQFKEAARVVLCDLRAGRVQQTPDQRARLYARLAYAYAEDGALRKASIACLGLCRVAFRSRSCQRRCKNPHSAG